MKNLNSTKAIRFAVALFALVTLATTAWGQTSNVMRVSVPFQFRAGHEVLPAGEYRIEVDPIFQRVKLSSIDGAAMGFLPGRADYAASVKDNSKLVFHEYGDVRFLRSVELAGNSVAYRFSESRAEREMAKLMTPAQVALLRK